MRRLGDPPPKPPGVLRILKGKNILKKVLIVTIAIVVIAVILIVYVSVRN